MGKKAIETSKKLFIQYSIFYAKREEEKPGKKILPGAMYEKRVIAMPVRTLAWQSRGY